MLLTSQFSIEEINNNLFVKKKTKKIKIRLPRKTH